MSLVLNQPKWKKFLSLKIQRNTIKEPALNGESPESNIPQPEPYEQQSATVAAPPTKKRKRTEEEIALRKEKKLKSKKKDGQDWKQLSEEHKSQLSAKPPEDEKNANDDDPRSKSPGPAKPISDAVAVPLLAAKAKDIVKARREEKLKEKPKQKKAPIQDSFNFDQKASEVLHYLEEYRSHINTGSEWKFKKQHQNWILKNLYTYAWESEDLVIPYLKSMMGQARERLALGAKEMIDDKEGQHADAVIRRAEMVLEALGE